MPEHTLVDKLGTKWPDEIKIFYGTPTQKVLPTIAPSGAVPNNGNHKVSDFLLKRVLTLLGVHYFQEDEGLCAILPSPDGSSALGLWFLIRGENSMSFQLFCTTDRTIALSQVPTAHTLCNSFHTQSRFGRAFVNSDEKQGTARICFDSHIDLTEGGREVVLKPFIRSSLLSAIHLFKMAEEEKGLYLPPPKNHRKTLERKSKRIQ